MTPTQLRRAKLVAATAMLCASPIVMLLFGLAGFLDGALDGFRFAREEIGDLLKAAQ